MSDEPKDPRFTSTRSRPGPSTCRLTCGRGSLTAPGFLQHGILCQRAYGLVGHT